MAILKIRQEDGSWAEIPALVGPAGPQGVRGERGERGEQGIQGEKGDSYVLTENDKAEIAAAIPIPGEYVTESELTAKGYLDSETDPTVPAWAKDPEKPIYTAAEVGADASGTAVNAVSAHNTDTNAHNDIRLLVDGLTARLNALADSDDATLDQLSEVVSYIKANRELIESVTTSKVSVSDIIDNLTTNVANKPLSAAQGVALKELIDAIEIPANVSAFANDAGYLTSYTESDPTVPAWAKSATKPSYTAAEVGALPSTTVVPSNTEQWTFILEDGSTVTKAVYLA